MDLDLIIARLKTQMHATFGTRVEGAAELTVALANPDQVRKPHAYIVWSADVEEDTQAEVPGQDARFAEEFSVVVVTDASVDTRGEDAVASVHTIKPLLRAALVGWAPSTSHLPIIYTGSSLAELRPTYLVHSFDFRTIVPGGSIFRYLIGFRVKLLTGITIGDVFTLYASQVETRLGASTRLDSDYMVDREAIPEGEQRYQLRMVPAGLDTAQDSSGALTELDVQLEVFKHLAPGADERTYTQGAMVTDLATFLPRSYWRDSSLTHSFPAGPTLELGAGLTRE
jgi:hypothetical protein